ncbi:MAG: YggS family pyridoxal phosphate-dependent enzyme [Planctomycetaceae bacterium]|nr:YggS family pyridoxal phosphate-dependent enzyme [Planctomycetaceae bacterium]
MRKKAGGGPEALKTAERDKRPALKKQTFLFITIFMDSQMMKQLEAVRQRIRRAAEKSGRTENDVQIVAVSKYAAIGDGIIDEFLENGLCSLGESRPQLLYEKAKYHAGKTIHWHLIGQLQRNKIRRILPLITLIHSIDSLKLAEAVNRIAEEDGIETVHCLLEIAVSQDANKTGFKITDVPELSGKLAALKHLSIDGLMTLASLESGEKQTHQEFASLRKLAETLRQHGLPPNMPLHTLSMGMSGDFETAVEEGATCVRLGSVLYPGNEIGRHQ